MSFNCGASSDGRDTPHTSVSGKRSRQSSGPEFNAYRDSGPLESPPFAKAVKHDDSHKPGGHVSNRGVGQYLNTELLANEWSSNHINTPPSRHSSYGSQGKLQHINSNHFNKAPVVAKPNQDISSVNGKLLSPPCPSEEDPPAPPRKSMFPDHVTNQITRYYKFDDNRDDPTEHSPTERPTAALARNRVSPLEQPSQRGPMKRPTFSSMGHFNSRKNQESNDAWGINTNGLRNTIEKANGQLAANTNNNSGNSGSFCPWGSAGPSRAAQVTPESGEPSPSQAWGPQPHEQRQWEQQNRRRSEPGPRGAQPDSQPDSFNQWCNRRSGGVNSTDKADSCGPSRLSLPTQPRQNELQNRYNNRLSYSPQQQYQRPVIQRHDQFTTWMEQFVEESKTYTHKFIDTHCHIDFIFKRMGIFPQSKTYSQFREDNKESFPVNYEGCVAIFCKPWTFMAGSGAERCIIDMLCNEDGVYFAFGCHPKSAVEFTDAHAKGLLHLLKSKPNVVALGEIGLDYSGDFYKHKDQQHLVFRTQLSMAVEQGLPLVIHCRDADEDCLAIMQELVPKEHKIHAHCFSRNWAMAQRWMAIWPNLFIGLTPVISYTSAREAIDTAKNVPLDRLLLETDAPYFVPGVANQGAPKWSHPGFALFTAQCVAKYQDVSVDTVLEACRTNTRNMYGI